MEKAYRTMKNSGAGSSRSRDHRSGRGITVGVISIINGASLLRHKKEIIF